MTLVPPSIEITRAVVSAVSAIVSESPPPVLDPGDGVEEVLTRLYGWWRKNQSMSGNVDRDRGAVPALDELMRETSDARFDALADALAAGEGAPYARAVIRLALRFGTWKSLAADGLSDAEAARAMARSARASCT